MGATGCKMCTKHQHPTTAFRTGSRVYPLSLTKQDSCLIAWNTRFHSWYASRFRSFHLKVLWEKQIHTYTHRQHDRQIHTYICTKISTESWVINLLADWVCLLACWQPQSTLISPWVELTILIHWKACIGTMSPFGFATDFLCYFGQNT